MRDPHITSDIHLTSGQAIALLNEAHRTVLLNIALGEYHTKSQVVYELVEIEKMGQTHIRNIFAIKDEIHNIFIPIDWTK